MSGKIINVSAEFRPAPPIRYPMHQEGPRFEEYVSIHCPEIATTATYLPIYWDNYAVQHRFGRDMATLQAWYDANVRNSGRQYWTVCEYADGLMIDASPNLHVFYCARDGGTTLPLMCSQHLGRAERPNLLASFVGSLQTHPCRKTMAQVFAGRNDSVVEENTGVGRFRHLMNHSWFALCPRGYGPTSYRISEALNIGAIPVYISDKFLLPYEDDLDYDFMVRWLIQDIDKLPDYLASISIDERMKMRDRCYDVYKEWFTMGAAVRYIKKYLEKRWPE